MKALIKGILMLIMALGFWACKDEPEAPLEVLPSDLYALQQIHKALGVDAEDYPVHWNAEDMNTWKNAGIELDTITDAESQHNYLAISSITLYLPREFDRIPEAILELNSLKDLKIFACAGSYFHGNLVPPTVNSLLVDRLNPDDSGYIIGVPDRRHTVVLGNKKAIFKKLEMHGVDMEAIDCMMYVYASVDLSHNTLEGDVPQVFGTALVKTPANLSFNKFTGLQYGWNHWETWTNISTIPMLQHNLIEDIPEEVLKSDFWKEYHENFIGNPGYKALGQ